MRGGMVEKVKEKVERELEEMGLGRGKQGGLTGEEREEIIRGVEYEGYVKGYRLKGEEAEVEEKGLFLCLMRERRTRTGALRGIKRGWRVYKEWVERDKEFEEAVEEVEGKITDELKEVVQRVARGEEAVTMPRATVIFFELKRREPAYRDTAVVEHIVDKKLMKLIENFQEARKVKELGMGKGACGGVIEGEVVKRE